MLLGILREDTLPLPLPPSRIVPFSADTFTVCPWYIINHGHHFQRIQRWWGRSGSWIPLVGTLNYEKAFLLSKFIWHAFFPKKNTFHLIVHNVSFSHYFLHRMSIRINKKIGLFSLMAVQEVVCIFCFWTCKYNTYWFLCSISTNSITFRFCKAFWNIIYWNVIFLFLIMFLIV